MKITKRLFLLMLITVLALVSFIPATFSWYPHNKSATGTKLMVAQDLPVSVKTVANSVTAVTHTADANGIATDTTVNAISLAPNAGKAVQYYKTTLQNDGDDDVMVDLETSGLANNADFYIGTVDPTVNEKAYASRAIRNKVSDTTVRVYFKTNNNFSPYWTNYVGDDIAVTFDSNITNDFNIGYRISGANSDTYAKLNRCSGTAWSSSNPASTVFYYDVPSNVDYFFFFNHWYIKSSSNKEWNCTINITDMTAGKLYYLTGNKVDDKWKEYAVETNNGSDIDKDLVAVNSYYSSVRLSTGAGVYADIGLKKTSDAEDFVPEYYGSSITYQVANGGTSVCTVNRDGLITPVGSGSTTITTTIRGKYGDTRTITTSVNIPASIDQVPIIKNVLVPAGEKVSVDWYALNKSPSATMETTSIFFTL